MKEKEREMIQRRVSTTGHAFDDGRALGRSRRLNNEPIGGSQGSAPYKSEAESNSFINGLQAGYNEADRELQGLAWAIEDAALTHGAAQA